MTTENLLKRQKIKILMKIIYKLRVKGLSTLKNENSDTDGDHQKSGGRLIQKNYKNTQNFRSYNLNTYFVLTYRDLFI